jgi:hypothetical protein
MESRYQLCHIGPSVSMKNTAHIGQYVIKFYMADFYRELSNLVHFS